MGVAKDTGKKPLETSGTAAVVLPDVARPVKAMRLVGMGFTSFQQLRICGIWIAGDSGESLTPLLAGWERRLG